MKRKDKAGDMRKLAHPVGDQKNIQLMRFVLYKDKIYSANSIEATNVFDDCLYFYRVGPMTHAQYKVRVKKGHKVVKQKTIIADTSSLIEYMAKHSDSAMYFVGISRAVMGAIYKHYKTALDKRNN